jgi:exopolysaccharide biosynthesis polyprenyl glycosylphosphotransferase
MRGVTVVQAAEFLESLTGKMPFEALTPSRLIFAQELAWGAARRGIKRLLDLILAVAMLALAAPALAAIALAIRLDSPGAALYRQERVGRCGRRFMLMKFRSMRPDAEGATGPVWAGERDPRVTRVGRVLRRFRLDELPQVFNVLRGEMSLIGPRPERPLFVQQLAKHLPYYELRHLIPPGITGWAQVQYPYGASIEDAREKLRYDLYYLRNQSLPMDIVILLHTVKIALFGRGAR